MYVCRDFILSLPHCSYACGVRGGLHTRGRGRGGGMRLASPCVATSSRNDTRSPTPAQAALLSNAPALLFAVHIAPLSLAAHMLSQQHSDIPNARSLAQSAMHAWQAALSRLQTACRALSTVTPPPPPCTSSTPRMWGALTHVHHISCMHL